MSNPLKKNTKKIREWHNVSKEMFVNDIAPLSKPAIFRGFVENWPLIQKGRQSVRAVTDYLKSFEQGVLCETILGSPEIEGRFFYQADMKSLNFDTRQETISTTLTRILKHLNDEKPPALFSGSLPIDECLPELTSQLVNPISGLSVAPKIWLGNAITVQTHYDVSTNIACVAAGRRRFTLFPPEQISNLYPGPIDFTPAGQPISMVQLHAPDFNKYPRFNEALASAEVAELEPGDAIYIPSIWWHHVQSLDKFNILVNYWWNGFQRGPDSPYTSLVHALLSIRGLPEAERMAWRAMFDHYIFKTTGDPVAHLADEHKGMLGSFNSENYDSIKNYFINNYAKDQKSS